MIKLAFLDHDLNNWHANKFCSLLKGGAGGGRFELVCAYENEPREPDWCAANGVARATSAEEAVAAADAVLVIAPDDPQTHLALARPALAAGKPVFIDKQLAHSIADARAIIETAHAGGAPLMSASSLRFANEVSALAAETDRAADVRFARGNGKWNGYATHTLGPALRFFGTGVRRLIDTGTKDNRLVTLDDGARRVLVEVRHAENAEEISPWTFGVLSCGKYATATVQDFGAMFANQFDAVLAFCESGQSPVPVEEQFLTTALECLADESQAAGGAWVDVPAI